MNDQLSTALTNYGQAAGVRQALERVAVDLKRQGAEWRRKAEAEAASATGIRGRLRAALAVREAEHLEAKLGTLSEQLLAESQRRVVEENRHRKTAEALLARAAQATAPQSPAAPAPRPRSFLDRLLG